MFFPHILNNLWFRRMITTTPQTCNMIYHQFLILLNIYTMRFLLMIVPDLGFVWECSANHVPKNFEFYFCLKWSFLYIFKSFWCDDVKNNFFKIIIKLYFDVFLSEKHMNRHCYHNPKHALSWVFPLKHKYNFFDTFINLQCYIKIQLS